MSLTDKGGRQRAAGTADILQVTAVSHSGEEKVRARLYLTTQQLI